MRLTIPCILIIIKLTFLVTTGHAAGTDTYLHILRPTVHADRDQAELCLESDHALDPENHARLIPNTHLENNGHKQSLVSRNIMIDGSSLCFLGLEHRHEYSLSLDGLRGLLGEKLSEPYHLDFTVPDRHASLVFIGSAMDKGVFQWRDRNPVLRAINVDHVHVELFHITDPAASGEAWRQRLQTTLAPSESVYFAKHNGSLVWQQDIELDKTPNINVEQVIDPSSQSSGLYLLVASAPQAEARTRKLSLAPLAAVWLLRSNLDLQSLQVPGGIHVLTDHPSVPALATNVHVILVDAQQKIVADAITDRHGMAFLPLSQRDNDGKAVVVGMTSSGDIAFSDTARIPAPDGVLSAEASITTDKNYYPPLAPIRAGLTLHDVYGQSLPIEGSVLKMVDASHNIFSVFPVTSVSRSPASLTIAAPAHDGLWSLIWVGADNNVLAQTGLRVSSHAEVPVLGVEADRSMLSGDGSLNLSIKSTSADGGNLPYVAGHVNLAWIVPDSLFSGFDGFTFGSTDAQQANAEFLTSFVTDEKGEVHIHATLHPPKNMASAQAARLTIGGDEVSGAVAVHPLIIPVRPRDFVIGLRAESHDGHFPENSLAHFSVIAVDANGKRRDASDLGYQIIEEGRHFDWYPTEGRWDYKPLRQERRLGGGLLTLSAQGDDVIEWPVSAGNYRLDIMSPDGQIMAHMPFSAGWGVTRADASRPGPLVLSVPDVELHGGQNIPVHFVLPVASVVTAVVADDRVRQIIHELLPKGSNLINVAYQSDWGKRIQITVNASTAALEGHIVLPSSGTKKILNSTVDNKAETEKTDSLTVSGSLPAFMRPRDSVDFVVELENNTNDTQTYHASLSASSGVDIRHAAASAIRLAPGQKGKLSWILAASLQKGLRSVRLDLTGTKNLHINRQWFVTVTDGFNGATQGSLQKIDPQQTANFWGPDTKYRNDRPVMIVGRFLPPALVDRLALFVRQTPVLTHDIASALIDFGHWHHLLVDTGILSESEFGVRHDDMLQALLTRQQTDGGFASQPGLASELASTTEAVYALKDIDLPGCHLAIDQASAWLRRTLDNGWFEESERPIRAAAYAALAAIGRVDVPSLYYFSDSSRNLSPLAAAQMASAFVAINDRPKAQVWLKTIPTDAGYLSEPSLLATMIANPLINPVDYLLRLQDHYSASDPNRSLSVEEMAAFLKLVAALNDRLGSWHVTLNGNDKIFQGIDVISGGDRVTELRNLTDAPLFAASVETATVKPSAASIRRRVYNTNGIEMMDALRFERNGVYVMVLEGGWPKEARTLVVRDEPGMALYPISCALMNATTLDDHMMWLKQQPLTDASLCEAGAHGLSIMLNSDAHHDDTWRIAYLVRAEWSGTFALSQPYILP